jgi:hypothetical protein
VFYADGNRSKGEWLNFIITGNGTMFYADGARYEGEWLNGTMTGNGTYNSAKGDIYEGFVAENGIFTSVRQK